MDTNQWKAGMFTFSADDTSGVNMLASYTGDDTTVDMTVTDVGSSVSHLALVLSDSTGNDHLTLDDTENGDAAIHVSATHTAGVDTSHVTLLAHDYDTLTTDAYGTQNRSGTDVTGADSYHSTDVSLTTTILSAVADSVGALTTSHASLSVVVSSIGTDNLTGGGISSGTSGFYTFDGKYSDALNFTSTADSTFNNTTGVISSSSDSFSLLSSGGDSYTLSATGTDGTNAATLSLTGSDLSSGSASGSSTAWTYIFDSSGSADHNLAVTQGGGSGAIGSDGYTSHETGNQGGVLVTTSAVTQSGTGLPSSTPGSPMGVITSGAFGGGSGTGSTGNGPVAAPGPINPWSEDYDEVAIYHGGDKGAGGTASGRDFKLAAENHRNPTDVSSWKDAIAKLQRYVRTHGKIDYLAIFDHGIDMLDIQQVGDEALTPEMAADLKPLFAPGAVILLGGCTIGGNPTYCNLIADATGADVVAADDLVYYKNRWWWLYDYYTNGKWHTFFGNNIQTDPRPFQP
jgi:hypothetical protein